MDIPYYLDPSASQTQIGKIDLFDYSTLEQTPGPTQQASQTVWQEIADAPTNFVNWTYNAVDGVWENVKTGVEGGLDTVTSGLTKTIDFIKTNVLYIFIGGIVLIYVLGKAGVFKMIGQIA